MTPALNEIIETLARITDTSPTLDAGRCLNLRHQQAGQCAACSDVCAVDAITLTPIPEIDSSTCLACGGCSAACPTDALIGTRPLSTLWHKARVMIDASGSTALVCAAMGAGEFHAVRIPCACALPPEFYIALAVAGALQVTIHAPPCAACPLGASETQAQQAVRDAQTVLALIECSLQADYTDKAPPLEAVKPAEGMTRRGLFRTFLSPEPPPPARADGVDALIADGIVSRRALLFDALDAVDIDPAATLPAYAGYWASVSASPACVGCTMCAGFCPTDALATTANGDGTVTLWFDTARCTACGLCLRACFKQALTFEGRVSLAALAVSEYRPIWQGKPAVSALKSAQAFKVRK
jgi:formate hydrogenlyase subunit 6/NADH:ubiquinone oxidoreductase subunit I